MNTYVHTDVYMVDMYTDIFTDRHVNIRMQSDTCTNREYTHMHTYETNIHNNIYAKQNLIFTFICICIYIYIYMYVCMYTQIYTDMYSWIPKYIYTQKMNMYTDMHMYMGGMSGWCTRAPG